MDEFEAFGVDRAAIEEDAQAGKVIRHDGGVDDALGARGISSKDDRWR